MVVTCRVREAVSRTASLSETLSAPAPPSFPVSLVVPGSRPSAGLKTVAVAVHALGRVEGAVVVRTPVTVLPTSLIAVARLITDMLPLAKQRCF